MADDDPKQGKDDADTAPDFDVALVHGRTEDGQGLRALRCRPDRLEATEIRQAQPGKPLHKGELISLHQRKESPLMWDVEVQYSPGQDSQRSGPAQVATSRYRSNWDAVFGGKKRAARRRLPSSGASDKLPN